MSKTGLPISVPAASGSGPDAALVATQADLARHRRAMAAFLGTQVMLDAALLPLAFSLSYRLAATVDLLRPREPVPAVRALIVLAIADLAVLIVFALSGFYRAGHGTSRVDSFSKICTHVSLGLVLAIAADAFAFAENAVFSRQVFVLGWLLTIVLITAGRRFHEAVVGRLRVHGVALDRLLIVGTGETARIVYDKVRRAPELGYEIVGFLAHVPDSLPLPTSLDGAPVYGTTKRLAAVVRRHQVDELILALEGVSHEEVLDLIYHTLSRSPWHGRGESCLRPIWAITRIAPPASRHLHGETVSGHGPAGRHPRHQ